MRIFDELLENYGFDNYVPNSVELDEEMQNELDLNDMENAIEVMEANKFVTSLELAGLSVDKACLESRMEDFDGMFLGEGLSDIKDKALEIWETFKEWVKTAIAKVKVFLAKFMTSRKQITILETQMGKVTNKATAIEKLGIAKGKTDYDTIQDELKKAIASADKAVGASDTEKAKTAVSELHGQFGTIQKTVRAYVEDNKYSEKGLNTVHDEIIKTMKGIVRTLDGALKSAETYKKKYERLGVGEKNSVKSDEVVSNLKGACNIAVQIQSLGVKFFFHELKVTKNIIAYAGKEAKLDTDQRKDLNKIKGRANF